MTQGNLFNFYWADEFQSALVKPVDFCGGQFWQVPIWARGCRQFGSSYNHQIEVDREDWHFDFKNQRALGLIRDLTSACRQWDWELATRVRWFWRGSVRHQVAPAVEELISTMNDWKALHVIVMPLIWFHLILSSIDCCRWWWLLFQLILDDDDRLLLFGWWVSIGGRVVVDDDRCC